MSALLKRQCKKRAGREPLKLTKGDKNKLQEGKNSPARRTGEPIVPPLKVSSDIVANLPGMLPGTNPGDYLPDDAHFDIMEVDGHKYQNGKPLVKPGHPPLTTMMRRFHMWYMDTCKSGKDILTLRVKEEHDLVGIDLLSVPFEEFFQFFNQKALNKVIVTCYCL